MVIRDQELTGCRVVLYHEMVDFGGGVGMVKESVPVYAASYGLDNSQKSPTVNLLS